MTKKELGQKTPLCKPRPAAEAHIAATNEEVNKVSVRSPLCRAMWWLKRVASTKTDLAATKEQRRWRRRRGLDEGTRIFRRLLLRSESRGCAIGRFHAEVTMRFQLLFVAARSVLVEATSS